ncbi:hypothetical protein CTEN210_13715 [Chaetoceros tenuissimus]|uniref:Uncharacterized protein n=1 Tax=Chaetoceros tenuissimus TaxID=426638 RepID=A0AAD3D756_9STRA|nr:hypothetical protein CTEN210_13715 [Chaetoceros tenuissimus]
MNISTFQAKLDFIKSIYFFEEWKDEECRGDILKAIEECNEKIEEAFGKSMHKLHKHKPSVDAVEKVIKKFPSTLSYESDVDGRIPIQSTAISPCVGYVPVLAKEGMKHKVGDGDERTGLLIEDGRGGLLIEDPSDGCHRNTLRCLIENSDIDDESAIRVFKELQKSGVLVKTDIKHLLWFSCYEENKMRFEFLVSCDPEALIQPFIHYIGPQPKDQDITVLLKAGFKHHPNIGGLLFVKDYKGTTAFDCLCIEKGKEKAMSLLYEILTPDSTYPILHHVFINAPQHKDLFIKKFPWAYGLKDHNGRTLHQAVLAAGPDIMNKNDIILASLSDDQIQTNDPITTLFPFAAMAVGEHADLEKTFYLLRRQPSVMDRHSRLDNGSSSNLLRKRRRTQK